MNLALQKRHEQLERWRQNEEQAEQLEQQQQQQQLQEEGESQSNRSSNSRSNQAVQQPPSRTTRSGNGNGNGGGNGSGRTNRIGISAYGKTPSLDKTSSGAKAAAGQRQRKRRPNALGDEGRVKFAQSTLFLNACANGDLNECKQMLEANLVDINVTTCDGLTGLHEAAICGNIEMVDCLLKRGANIDCCDNEGWTPLHAAASLGQCQIVELLLKHGASVAIVNCENFLAYDLARTDQVRELIGNHMEEYDIDQLRRQEELLIEQDIERWLKTGHYEERSHPITQATVLHVLAAKGYLKLLARLIGTPAMRRQLNLEARDSEGFTPLLAASFWNQADIVELLIEHGANIFAQANSGYKISSIHLKNYQDSKLQQAQTPRPTIARATRPSIGSLNSDSGSPSANDGGGTRQCSVSSLADSTGDNSANLEEEEEEAAAAGAEGKSIGDNIPSASARRLRSSQHGQLSKSKSLELANQTDSLAAADSPLLHGSMSVDRLLLRADSMGERDLRKSFKELVMENERLKRQLKGSDDKDKQRQQDWIRKERQLHRKISELEEESKQLEQWKQEIQRLKDENNSLIRVVSKLTNQHH